METVPISEKNGKIGIGISNFSDDELIFKALCLKCHSLRSQKMTMLQVRENLTILNEKNERIYKSLLKIKTDYEIYKSYLYKTLNVLKVSTEKQKVLLIKKMDEFHMKHKIFQEYCKVSPCKLKLDELTSGNRSLEIEWESRSNLLKLTKKQYSELKNLIIKAFKKKVCEFCDIVLKLEASNNEVNWKA